MAYWSLKIGPYPASTATNYSANTDYSQWTFYQSIRHNGSQASGVVYIRNKELPRPKTFHEIRLLYPSGQTLFGGIIQRVRQVIVNADTVAYYLECSDYTRWLDHIPAGAKAYNGDIDVVIKQLIDDWVTNSVATSFGHLGPSVPMTYAGVRPVAVSSGPYNPNFIFVSQAIDYLCKTFYCLWYIDVTRDLIVFLPDTEDQPGAPLPPPAGAEVLSWYDQDPLNPVMLSSFTIPTLYADTDTTNYFDLELTEESSSTISGVLVKDYSELSVTQDSEAKVGDGTTKQFQLYSDPADPKHTTVTNVTTGKSYKWNKVVGTTSAVGGTYTLTDTSKTWTVNQWAGATVRLTTGSGDEIQTTQSAKIASNTATVLTITSPWTVVPTSGEAYAIDNMLTEYVDGQPSDVAPGDVCFVCTVNRGFRFGVAPAAADQISVAYNYYFIGQSPYQAIALSAEIASREGFGAGYYYDVFSGETAPITVSEGTPPWQALQQIMLKRYARIKIKASFKSYTAGWVPGQRFAIVSDARGDSSSNVFTGWGTRFVQRFFVTQTNSTIINDTTVLTEVEAVSDLWGE